MAAQQPQRADPRSDARATLTRYRDGGLSLEMLIDWAHALETSAPSAGARDRSAQALANPLLCREEAMAFVRDLLES